MQGYHWDFIRNAFVLPGLASAAVAVAVFGGGEKVVHFNTPTVIAPYERAEAVVEDRTASATRGRTCYDDPTGHEPSQAVVKDDGTTTVRTVSADEAWRAAHAGEVWVLAWCD